MYERYCQMRDNLNLKDSDVAKHTGITPSTFSDWKKGKSSPNADKLVKIARFLNTTVEYLVTGEDAPAAAPAYRITAFEFQIIIAYRQLSEDAQDVVLSSLKLERPREKKELLQA